MRVFPAGNEQLIVGEIQRRSEVYRAVSLRRNRAERFERLPVTVDLIQVNRSRPLSVCSVGSADGNSISVNGDLRTEAVGVFQSGGRNDVGLRPVNAVVIIEERRAGVVDEVLRSADNHPGAVYVNGRSKRLAD